MNSVLSRKTAVSGALALALAIACSACGGSSPAKSGPPTTATLSQQLLHIDSTIDATLKKDTVQGQLAQSNAKYSVAFGLAASEINKLHWPKSMKPQVTPLVTALQTMAALATKVSVAAAKPQTVQANVLAMAQENLKLMEEEKVEFIDANALRHDLGIPAVTTTTTASTPGVIGPGAA
jgi:hypothetical protein